MHGKKVGFTETVLRDGAQSLIATRLSYDKMEPVLKTMNETGYYSAEVWGGATFDVCLRFLNEDPWERLRKIREKMPDTKLQMLLRGQNILGYKHYPDNIVRRFVRKSVENGIDSGAKSSGSWENSSGWRRLVDFTAWASNALRLAVLSYESYHAEATPTMCNRLGTV